MVMRKTTKMRFAASLQTRMSERPGSPVLLQMHGARCRRRHCVSFSVTVKRTVTLTNGPRARSGSGSRGKKHYWGCEPTCTIAYCPQPFWLKGPLEPPCGRTPDYLVRSRELTDTFPFDTSNYPKYIIGRAKALWRRALLVPSAGRERRRGPSVLDV